MESRYIAISLKTCRRAAIIRENLATTSEQLEYFMYLQHLPSEGRTMQLTKLCQGSVAIDTSDIMGILQLPNISTTLAIATSYQWNTSCSF